MLTVKSGLISSTLTVALLFSSLPAKASTPTRTCDIGVTQSLELDTSHRDLLLESPPRAGDLVTVPLRAEEDDLIDRLERLEDEKPRSRTWVEQAPKTWPFPMVISPWQPVLPGSVW